MDKKHKRIAAIYMQLPLLTVLLAQINDPTGSPWIVLIAISLGGILSGAALMDWINHRA